MVIRAREQFGAEQKGLPVLKRREKREPLYFYSRTRITVVTTAAK
jgi:hypothetical protein